MATTRNLDQDDRGPVGRIWSVVWLPLLLTGIAVALTPLMDEFVLGVVLLVVALAVAEMREP